MTPRGIQLSSSRRRFTVFYDLKLTKMNWTRTNDWHSTKMIWTVQNDFEPIEGQGISTHLEVSGGCLEPVI